MLTWGWMRIDAQRKITNVRIQEWTLPMLSRGCSYHLAKLQCPPSEKKHHVNTAYKKPKAIL